MKPNTIDSRTLAITIPRRWISFLTFLFLCLMVSFFCFAASAQAYTLTLRIVDGPTENAVLVKVGTTTTQYGPHPTQSQWDITIPSGASVTLTALPDASSANKWYFDRFNNSPGQDYENPTSWTMYGNASVQAEFNTGGKRVTLSNPGTGSGTVRWGINGWDWMAGQHFNPGQSVVIGVGYDDYIYFDDRVSEGLGPDAGSTNAGWTGVEASSDLWRLVSIRSDKNVTVTFNNSAPTISDITDRTINEDTNTGTINFTVGDTETPVASLTVTALSSNATLVPNDAANLTLGGTDANRTLVVTPAADQSGTATITVTVQDQGGKTASDTFVLTVSSVNDAPVANDATVAIDENTANGTSVHTVAATDVDVPAQTLTYAVVGGSGAAAFAINSATGEITVANASLLDHEANASLTLQVQVTDNGTPSTSDTATITVNLNDIKFTLTVVKAGTAADGACTLNAGAGSPSGLPGGSGFPATYTYQDGDVVTLTATDTYPGSSGSLFKGWSGDASGTNDTVAVTMDADKTVTATFDRTYALTIAKAGTGDGSVSATAGSLSGLPAGGATVLTFPSVIVYEAGDSLNLSASGASDPFPGSAFKGFSGDAAGMAPTLTMTSDKSVTATFNQQWNLTVENPASGQGTFDASAGSISGVGGVNNATLPPENFVDITYEQGDVVTLSDEQPAASPDPGSVFKGWSATSATMDANKTVTATFVQRYRLTPVAGVNGTISPAVDVILEHGQSQTFTMTSGLPSYTVVENVLVDGASVATEASPPAPTLNSSSYTFTSVAANHTIGATFSDFGFDCGTAAQVGFPPNESVTIAEINPAGEWDYFMMVVPTAGTVKVYTTGGADTVGYLLDGTCSVGASLAANDDRDQNNNNFYIERRLDPGTYYVAVRFWESDPGAPTQTGAYTLMAEYDISDHGDSPATATFVSCNNSEAGTIETGGNVDYFAVSLTGDGRLTVYTTGLTDTVGKLYDSNETLITTDTNSGPDNNFQIERTLTAGIYYVAVSHNDAVNGTGTYTFNVGCELTHTITATAGFGGSISPEGTVHVDEGQTQSFTITPDGTNTIYDVEVDGASVGAVSTYTFTNVAANHTIVANFQLPAGTCVDISDVPLDARFQSAPANVMFVLDDSGSMDWEVLTTDSNGCFYIDASSYTYVFDNPGDNIYSDYYGWILARGTDRLHWKSQWYGHNRIYYNPSITYEPWPTLSAAHPDLPRSHPQFATPTFNLSASYETIDTGAATLITYVDNQAVSPTFQKTPDKSPVIIDEKDPGYSKSGSWYSTSSSTGQAYNAYYDQAYLTGTYTATWTPNLSAGEYEVYARWEEGSNRSNAVPYTINHAGGSTTVTKNQKNNGGKWVSIGTYNFNEGAGNVSITATAGTSSRISADAIKFSPTGAAWDWATNAQCYNNHYWYTPANGTYTATWTPNLPAQLGSAVWEVSVRWTASGERSNSVTYTVNHALGSTDVTKNQREHGGEWVSLGSFTFNAGTGGSVVMNHHHHGANDSACADAVRFTPQIPATIDIKNAHYYTWHDEDGDNVRDPGEIWLVVIDGSLSYYRFTDADADDVIDVGELLPVTDLNSVPAAVKTGKTYAQERQNFANYYSFYRRRELSATAAVSRTIATMQGANVGIYTINRTLVQPVLPVRVGTQDQTGTLLNSLYNMVLAMRGTPLREGLQDVGMYFHANDGQTGMIGNSPYASAANGGECQQAFAIVMTDGYWNFDVTRPISVANADGDHNTAYDGGIYGDNYSPTLADVAMYYYERDLSSSLANIVPTNPQDSATHQHMVTYTVSFGLRGTLDPGAYDMNSGPYPVWPRVDVDGTPEKIDDLWHAAVNGRGEYLSAANTQELVEALQYIMQNIESRMGSSSSVSVNGDELYDILGADVRMFQSTYSSDSWSGDVKSYQVDLDTGEVLMSSPVWSASTQLESKNWDTGRIIGTYNGLAGTPFRFDSLTDELKELLDANWESGTTNARRILNYLRGEATYEQKNGGTFRNRFSRLGDIVHSSPVYVDGTLYAGANDGMLHAFDAETGNELFAYIPKLVFANLKNLADPLYYHKFFVDLTPAVGNVYVTADTDGVDNDEDGTTDETGETRVKKILVGGLGKGGKGYYALDVTDPASVLTEGHLAGKALWEYPNPRVLTISNVSYEWSWGADPIVITTTAAHGYSTGDQVLIEGVRGTTEANGTWTVTRLSDSSFRLNSSDFDHNYSGGGTASKVVSSWNDMGYSYSKPALVNSKAGYIVMFGNGYNSQTGIAKLMILNAETGALLKSINTQQGNCNGLSTPVPIDVDFDGKVDYVYAGDLKGNLWKFDLTDADSNNWDVAYKKSPYTLNGSKYVGTTPEPVFQARSPEGVAQPITSKPDVMAFTGDNGYMVIFGTGKWLGEFDYESTVTQTLYGIWDYGDDDDDSEYLGVFDRGSTPQLRNQLPSVTLLQQTLESCSPSTATCDGDFWVVNNLSLRVLTDNIFDVDDPWETSSYYNGNTSCGEGDGMTGCEPNGHGTNPDPVHLAGWYFDLPLDGERVISDALIRQGKAIFVPFTPSHTPCGAGGETVVMEVDAWSGGRTKNPLFDINGDLTIDQNDLVNIGTTQNPIWVAPTGVKYAGRLQSPAILRVPDEERERKYMSSSRGTIVTLDEKAVTVGVTYWMEFD